MAADLTRADIIHLSEYRLDFKIVLRTERLSGIEITN
jgi:hypothetical protein